ncbi:hypothetical protein [Caulobacter sp. BE254]|uniref:hypothetical protein n=1 Tax=Caulobacter sp. BE254 TaxID=2817720 RepID=UPI0028643C70|nr:hypothetical protein [Caulobacter sp. BE254]MDR7115876.1 hypothetical protein [Caulobacter sp. BE254]
MKLPTGCAPIDLRLRGFGGAKGTLIVADYEAIRSHREAILAAGFAYSVFDVGAEGAYRSREDILDLLRDWTWTGAPEDRPVWLDKTP